MGVKSTLVYSAFDYLPPTAMYEPLGGSNLAEMAEAT